MTQVKEVKVHKSIRIQPSLLKRAEDYADNEEHTNFIKPSVNSVLCNAIAKGMEQLERARKRNTP